MILSFSKNIQNFTFYSFLLILALTLSSFVTEAKNYRGIRPLKTTRVEVEAKFGKPDKNGNYKIGDELFNVYYGKFCDNQDDCNCLVNPDTVIKIQVYIHHELRLKQLKLQLNRYEKTSGNHLIGLVTYSSSEEGVIYQVHENDGERVRAVTYLPSSKDCQNLLETKSKRALI